MKKIKTIKRGRLSAEEKKQIEVLCETKSDEEIGKLLRRPVDSVKLYRIEYLTNNPGLASKKNEHVEIRESLHSHYQWESFKKEFSADELIHFEHSYIEWVSQFGGNVLASERKQIFQAITIELFMARHNRERQQVQSDIDRMEKLIELEFSAKSPEEMTAVDRERVGGITSQINSLRQTTQSKTKEYKDLSDRYSAITKELKGLRQQRIDRIDTEGKNFIGILKNLEDEELRNRTGTDMLIMNHAIDKEFERLSQYHTYMNGEVDFPLNTPEIVLAAAAKNKAEMDEMGEVDEYAEEEDEGETEEGES